MSNLILGGVGFAQLDRRSSDRLLGVASEIGISAIDTAPTYGNSEEVIGYSQKICDWQISTKVGSPYGAKLSRKEIVQSIESSLRKLNISNIHTCFIHSMSHGNVDEVLMETLDELKTQGKISFFGYSGDGKDLDQVVSKHMFDTVMATLNVLDLSNYETLRKFNNQPVYLKRILGNGVFRIRPRLELVDFLEKLSNNTSLDTDSYAFRFQKIFGGRSLLRDYPKIFLSFLLSLELDAKYLIGTTNIRHLHQIRKVEEEMNVWKTDNVTQHISSWANLSKQYSWSPLI